jgi:RHS repeat-associated protein
LSYLQNRYYNSSEGQFISQDSVFLGNPSHQNLQDPQSLNSYSYSEDNPIIKEDPNGKFVELLPVIAAAYLVYSAAQFSVDSYNAYNMDAKYGGVTSQSD